MSAPYYSGHVSPGGPPATRLLPGLSITKLSVGPMDNNAYLLTCRASGQSLLIDAANDAARILALLPGGAAADGAGSDAGGELAGIVTTHRHADHWQALAEVAAATGARCYAGAADAAQLPVAVDVPLSHGDQVRFGQVRLGVIGLRGHTPGSVALLYEDPAGSPHLFTGDSLFPGGPGRTNSPADFTSLMDDLTERVFDVLPDATWVYPGHGDDTTLRAERPQLPAWRARGW